MRDTRVLHPELQEIIPQFLANCFVAELYVKITDTYRSVDEQNACVAAGNSKASGSTYSSMHQWKVAFDICRNDGKGAYTDNDGWFAKVAKIGKALGLDWGGEWTSFPDKPHFQHRELAMGSSTPSKLKAKWGSTPDKFFKTFATSSVKDNWANLSVDETKKLLDKFFNAKTSANCKLYKQASTLEGKITSLSKGTRLIQKKDMGNGWSKVKYGTHVGYVKNTCLNARNLSKYPTAKVTKAVWLRTVRKLVKASRIKKLKVGTKVSIIAVKKTWALVRVDGETGYVKKKRIGIK